MTLLDIRNLDLQIESKSILKDFNLSIKGGETHVLMGPNGSGKSSLACLLAGKPGLTVTKGSIQFLNQPLLELTPETRALQGLFLGFQHPVVIPGVSTVQFLNSATNAIRKARGLNPLDAVDFLTLVKEKMAALNIPLEFLYRPLNEGFSGGEKKRNEVLQLSLLEPTLSILDEIDSGLDLEGLTRVGSLMSSLKQKGRAFLFITHSPRFLEYLEPDFIHILSQGKLIRSGDKKLLCELEAKGFAGLAGLEEAAC